ncbi:MAG TPA: LLM class flavin-dependent oxidoreductase [Pseudonocardia sp.]|nr:LLM class flavin-dependent oxidoreductase [Pseudonocardia sp.]
MSRQCGMLFEMQVARVPTPGEKHTAFDGEGQPYEVEAVFTPEATHRAFHDVVEEVVQAEKSGYTSAWFVEHHFYEEASQSSAPDVMLSHIAAKTERIRLGHGVRLLPHAYNHPVRAAESAAVLDLLSNGRLEFGTGRSLSRLELEGFGIDPAATREQWDNSLGIIVDAWTKEVVERTEGPIQFPPRSVVPKPLQQPHPPLWAATTGAPGHELMGRKGLGLLSFTLMLPVEELASRIALYREGIKHAEPVGHFVNDQVAAMTMVHCHQDGQVARERAADAVMGYLRWAFAAFVGAARWMDPREGTYNYLQEMLGIDIDQLTFDIVNDNDMVIVGTPDECKKKAERYFDAGVDQMLCQMSLPGLSHDHIMESIELFGREVIPAVT